MLQDDRIEQLKSLVALFAKNLTQYKGGGYDEIALVDNKKGKFAY